MDPTQLQCIICPGHPRFSDVSHLLTHVSSKAHLSHYFKLQVRSHQEAAALELLLEYDGWFNSNNLPRLLSERIGSKDDRKKKRKSQSKTPVPAADTGQRPVSTRSRGSGPVEPSLRPTTSLPENLDPRLAGPYDKTKLLDNGDVAFSCQVTPATSASVATGVAPRDAEVGTAPAQSLHNAKPGEWPEEDAPDHHGTYTVPFPVTPSPPTWTRNRPNEVTWRSSNRNLKSFTDGVCESPDEILDDNDADAVRERADEMAKLKGVLWPGMDIFDSATRQMRRKRNQKKDGTVLRKMERTAALVEPTELIFSPSGILRKQRVITGNVEDDSPLKGESPVPKRRLARPRPSRPRRRALGEIDSNVARGRGTKRTRRVANAGPSGVTNEVFQDDSAVLRFQNPLSGFGSSVAADEDFELSVQAFGKRARSGFTIFADGDDLDMQRPGSQRTHSEVFPDTLTPARLVLDGKHESSAKRKRNTELPALDKENVEPILNTHGGIESPTWNNSPFLKRSVQPRYLPRSVFDESSNMSLSHDMDHDAYGYRSNPLLLPASKLDFYGKGDVYDTNVTVVSSSWTATTQPAPSEATEEDHHELAQLYLENTAD